MKDWYTPTNAFWLRKRDLDMNVTGPVFDFKGKEYTRPVEQGMPPLAARHRARSAARITARRSIARRSICNEDVQLRRRRHRGARSRPGKTPNGTRWVLVPFWGPKHSQFTAPIEHGDVVRGGVAAFKMEEQGGKVRADAGLAVAGHGSGRAAGHRQRRRVRVRQRREHRAGDVDIGLGFNTAPTAWRSRRTRRIYALDARTGKELWSSGDQITSFNHFSGLSVANGRVYIGTYDGTLYCFGVDERGGPIERQTAARRDGATT